jgi:hypothetical protein
VRVAAFAQLDLAAWRRVREDLFVDAPGVVLDDGCGRLHNVPRRAIVLGERDRARAADVPLEDAKDTGLRA